MKTKSILLTIGLLLSFTACRQGAEWKKGILIDEFVYEKTSFPECHSASLAETPEGIVLTFFGGTKERHPDASIWICRNENGVWTEPEKAADGVVNDTLRYPCWNPVLYQVPGEELLLFYKVGPSPGSWWGCMKRSFDNGKTWSAEEKLPEGIIGPVKNKPVVVDGKLFCPSSTENRGWRLHIDVTEDKGKTWTQIGPLNDPAEWLAIQPSILFHKNGDLQILCRTRNRLVGSTWSTDRGRTWSQLEGVGLPNNNSGTDAVTLKDGRHLLVYNHVEPPAGETKGARTPLNVALSKDGKTWYASLVLEDSPISQYSYPCVIQSSDGYVHIAYTWRRQRIKYVKIDPSKLKMKEIENGIWPGRETAQAVEGAGSTPFPISVCDWMILKRQKLGAIQLSREIGCDGLEIDMGGLGNRPTFDNKLKDPEVLAEFKRTAQVSGIRFSSVAMSGFYAQSLVDREDFITPVQDCIDVMKGLGVKVAFLPLGVKGDLVKNPELRPAIVERLKVIGQLAEKEKVLIGIETALDAAGDKALLQEIGSPGIKIYFNFGRALQTGKDLHQELRILGEDICMIHCTNKDSVWLENDPMIDMPAVKRTLEEIGYRGWLVMERSRDASQPRNVRGNYGANCAYLKSVFQPE